MSTKQQLLQQLQKQQYYYKILSSNLKSLCYLANTSSIHDLAIQYYFDEWNYPPEDRKESHLFVFRSMEDVKYFLYSYPGYKNYVIYKVEVKDIKKNPRFIDPWEISMERLHFICRQIRKKMKISLLFNTNKLPKGTVAVGAIKLVEKVGLYDSSN